MEGHTTAELKDRLAELRNCQSRTDPETGVVYWKQKISDDWTRTHPIGPHIDDVLRAMPEGWQINRNDLFWFVFAPLTPASRPGCSVKVTGHTVDHWYHDILALAVAAWEAQKGKP